jgi:acyl carrier protein
MTGEGSNHTGQSATEKTLLRIWGRVLKRESIEAVTDNFFDLGGDSIDVISMLHGIEKSFGVIVSPGAVFCCPTVAELARHIDLATAAARNPPSAPSSCAD